MIPNFDALSETLEYTNNLPKTNFEDIRNRIFKELEIYLRRKRKFEEITVFQTFGNYIYFLGNYGKQLLENQLNKYFSDLNYPIKIKINQIIINGIPTMTYEVIVTDKSFID